MSLAREMLGFEATYDLGKGLAESVAWYRENLD
jgi:nucleoside-diphosphate-sugar epimerase